MAPVQSEKPMLGLARRLRRPALGRRIVQKNGLRRVELPFVLDQPTCLAPARDQLVKNVVSGHEEALASGTLPPRLDRGRALDDSIRIETERRTAV